MDINDRLKEVVERSEKASVKLDSFVNGSKTTIVHGLNGDYPSLAKIADDTKKKDAKLDASVASATASEKKSKEWATSTKEPEKGLKSSKTYATEAKTSAASSLTSKNSSVKAQTASEKARDESKKSQVGSDNTAKASAASANKSKDYAEKAEDQHVEQNTFSSKHYSAKSAKSSSSAASSAKASAASEKVSTDKANLAGISAEKSETSRKASDSSKVASIAASNNSKASESKSKDWATKTNGAVEGTLYSAKKYATDAATSAASSKASQDASKASQTASKTSEVNASKSNESAKKANSEAKKSSSEAKSANEEVKKALITALDPLKDKFDKSGGVITGRVDIKASGATLLNLQRTDSDANITIGLSGKTLMPSYFGVSSGGVFKFGHNADLNKEGFDIFHKGRLPSWAEVSGKPKALIYMNMLETVNLDDVIETGWYDNQKNVNATTAKNYPTLQSGWLEVFKTESMIYQRYMSYSSDNKTYYRSKYQNKWSSWSRSSIAGESYLKAETDSKYLPKGSKAVDSSKLEGKTKSQVIEEARTGYETSKTAEGKYANISDGVKATHVVSGTTLTITF